MQHRNQWRRMGLTTLLLSVFLFGMFPIQGAPGDLDPSFYAGSGIDGSITGTAVLPNGKVYILGTFSTVNGAIRPGVARLNPDGTNDPTFERGKRI